LESELAFSLLQPPVSTAAIASHDLVLFPLALEYVRMMFLIEKNHCCSLHFHETVDM
jgi:hypothetical protein